MRPTTSLPRCDDRRFVVPWVAPFHPSRKFELSFVAVPGVVHGGDSISRTAWRLGRSPRQRWARVSKCGPSAFKGTPSSARRVQTPLARSSRVRAPVRLLFTFVRVCVRMVQTDIWLCNVAPQVRRAHASSKTTSIAQAAAPTAQQ